MAFTVSTISFHFDDNVAITLESSYQHQQVHHVKNRLIGSVQSVPATCSTLPQLIDHVVVAATANEEEAGTLSLFFDDGQVVRFIENRTPYESYTFTDGTTEYIV